MQSTAKTVESDYTTPYLPATAVSRTVLQVPALRHRSSLGGLQCCGCNHSRQIERAGRHGSLVSYAPLPLPPVFAEAVSLTGCAGRWRCGSACRRHCACYATRSGSALMRLSALATTWAETTGSCRPRTSAVCFAMCECQPALAWCAARANAALASSQTSSFSCVRFAG